MRGLVVLAIGIATGLAGCGDETASFVADCRNAAYQCAPSFECAEGEGGWECVSAPAAAGDAGLSWELDAPEGVDVVEPVDTVEAPEDTFDAGVIVPDVGIPDVVKAEDTGGGVITPLTIAIDAPGAVLTGLVTFTATVEGGGYPLGVEFQIDGVPWQTDIIPPFAMQVNTSQLPDGPHVIAAFTADEHGQQAGDQVDVVFDNSPPTFETLTPGDGATVFYEDGPLRLAADVVDSAPLALVTFRANGLLVGEFAKPPYIAQIEHTSLFVSEEQLPKNVYLQFRAEDVLGQVTEVDHNAEIHKRLVWKHDTQGAIWGPGAALPDGRSVFGNLSNRVVCLTAEGGESWSFDVGGELKAGVTVDPATGATYTGSITGRVQALSSDGGDMWSAELGSAVSGAIAVQGQAVAAVTLGGGVRVFDKASGDPLWQADLPPMISASPTLDETGVVYVGGLDNALYAVAAGEVSWKVLTAGEVHGQPAIGPNGAVYFGSDDGWLYVVKKGGQAMWQAEVGGTVRARPLPTADSVIAAGSDGTVVRLAALDGSVVWSKKLELMDASSPVADADGTIYVGSVDGTLYALASETGEVLFTYAAPETIHVAPIVIGDRVLFTGTAGTVYNLWRNGTSLVKIPEQ